MTLSFSRTNTLNRQPYAEPDLPSKLDVRNSRVRATNERNHSVLIGLTGPAISGVADKWQGAQPADAMPEKWIQLVALF